MTQINLLPWREKARKARQTKFYITLGMSVLAAIFCVMILRFYNGYKIVNQTFRNAYLESEISKEQVIYTDLDKKMKQKIAIDSELHFILSLRESGYRTVQLLDELVKVIPEGITLKKMMREENQIMISGKADSNLAITLLMKHIANSTLFFNPELTDITGKEDTSGEERVFRLTFSQR